MNKIVTKISRYRLKGTTDASGDATVTSDKVARGKIKCIVLNIAALDAGADTAITSPDDIVDQTICNLTNNGADTVLYPKILATLNTGGALTATGNTYEDYCIFSRLKAVIAQGGDTKAFTIDVYVEEY